MSYKVLPFRAYATSTRHHRMSTFGECLQLHGQIKAVSDGSWLSPAANASSSQRSARTKSAPKANLRRSAKHIVITRGALTLSLRAYSCYVH